jgi:hypothetical protein
MTTTTTQPQANGNETQLRQLLIAQQVCVRELDGLLDRYAAAALVGGPGTSPSRQPEPRRGRWTYCLNGTR